LVGQLAATFCDEDGRVQLDYKPVTITEYEPAVRSY